MATTYTAQLLLGKPAKNDTGWWSQLNANFDIIEALAVAYGLSLTTGNISLKKLLIPSVSALTIASDAITVTGSHHTVDPEAAAATDNLATINGGSAGQLLFLRTFNAGRDVTIVDNNQAGGNNIRLVGNVNFTLTDTDDLIVLFCPLGSVWYEVSRLDIG